MFYSRPTLCILLVAASVNTHAADAHSVRRTAPSANVQTVISATTWKESVIHAFRTPELGGDDGSVPLADLLRNPNSGVLFGTTSNGGSKGGGTVFELTAPVSGKTAWTEKILYNFVPSSKGGFLPSAGVIADAGGALYGTTAANGTGCYAGYCGTVFKLMPPAPGKTDWTESVLHNFVASAGDGSDPVAALVMDASGALYGTTVSGGVLKSGCNGVCGTVFKVTPPAPGKTAWTETILHSFTGVDGANPYGNLILEGGALYGTTSAGGPRNYGTVFKLSPPAPGKSVWTQTILHAFGSGPDDGATPKAGLIDIGGTLYGTTSYGGPQNCLGGCGSVFKLTPPTTGKSLWTYDTLHFFGTSTADGSGFRPSAALIADRGGALYSTTLYGGAGSYGTVFKLTPPASGKGAWTPSLLHDFTDANGDGGFPAASLVGDPSGNVYGTASVGGLARVGAGIVFELHE